MSDTIKIFVGIIILLFCLNKNACSEVKVLKTKDKLYDFITMKECSSLLIGIDTINIKMALNESEPITFWIEGNRNIENVGIVIDKTLYGEDNNKIKLEECKFFYGKTTRLENNYFPFFLINFKKIRLIKNQLVYIWINIRIPEDSQQGKYFGNIKILDDNNIINSLTLCIEVYPIKLSKPDIPFGMYYDEARSPQMYSSLKYQKKYFEDMKNHEMNSVTVYNYLEFLKKDGSCYCDFEKSWRGSGTGLNTVMKILKESKLVASNAPILFLSKKEGNSLGGGDLNMATIKKIIQQSRENDWPEFLFYLVDEPFRSGFVKNARTIYNRSYKVLSRSLMPKLITAIGPKGIQQVGDLYDIWMYDIYFEQIEKYRLLAERQGKDFWIYDCRPNRFSPGEQRYFAGLFTYKAKAKGNFCWVYIHYKDLYLKKENQVFPAYIPKYGYVLPSNQGPIPFIKWEARREGIDDYRYLITLEEIIKKAKTIGKLEEAYLAAQTLNSIMNTIKLEWNTLLAHRFLEIKETLAKIIISLEYEISD